MSRETVQSKNRIALLTTGDEVVNGDITNSNAQVISHKLVSKGFRVGIHMSVSDRIHEIEECIAYLLKSHRCLIITGGLGPTSDDLTRYALSNVTRRPLQFNEETWLSICERFKILGYKGEPPEGNKQQAFFPSGATILPNGNGTAAGCVLSFDDQLVFMLPGPPSECLPLVDNVVLPCLEQQQFKEIQFFDYWLLFGIGESLIADKVDELAKQYQCVTGYRIAFPYIEVKLWSSNEEDFKNLSKTIYEIIKPYLLNNGKEPVSTTLRNYLIELDKPIFIQDKATGGLLEHTLVTPKTQSYVKFDSHNQKADFVIEGLEEYWLQKETDFTNLKISMNEKTLEKQIPLRGRGNRVLHFALEFICHQILQCIQKE